MTLSFLFSHSGPVLLALLAGLLLSAAVRERPWVLFVWLPTIAIFVGAALMIAQRLGVIGRLHGPDRGFAGMESIFLLPAFGICVAGLVVGFFVRPRKEAWRLSSVLPAMVLWLGVAILLGNQNCTRFDIELTDLTGKNLVNTPVEFHIHEGGLQMTQSGGATDTHGRFSFRLRKNQSAQLQLEPRPHNGQIYNAPTFWNLDIAEQRAAPSQWNVRHSWQRPVGDTVLNESFTEIIPSARRIRLALMLPPHESLEPGPLRDKIQNTLVAFHHSTPQGMDLGYFCRNVESIEFIPLLIETYSQNEKGRESVIAGLKQVAAILSELATGARQVQRYARLEPHYPRTRLTYEVTQLCKWAHTPYESKSDAVEALGHVQEKIDADTGILIEFVSEQLRSDDRVLEIVSELGRLGHPAIPDLIDQLVSNPPTETHGLYQWSHSLWMIGAHFQDLDKLISSQNPVLVVLACEAIPNEQLNGSTAAKVLERLEGVRPQIIDAGIQQRADMHIKMLRARTSSKSHS